MKEYCLGDLISIKHGYAFDGDHITSEDNGIVLVTPGNFKIGGGFQEDKCKFFSGEVPDNYVLHPGDYIVTMTDLSKTIDTLGYSAIIPKRSSRTYLHNQRIGLISFISDSCDHDYIYYVMQTHEYQRAIANSSTGSTVHHTSPTKICQYRFYAPEKSQQIQIAKFLRAYDDLIENNRKQIKLLEEAAQRLYKEWFIDLRFPGHEHTPIINGIPEGWSRRPISTIAEYLNGYAFKPSDWQKRGCPIIKIKEMNQGVSDDTPRNDGKDIPLKYMVKTGDILFSWSATLAAIIWNQESGWLNQHLFKVTPHDGFSREFVFQAIANTINEFQNLTTGATMKHIQRGKLDEVFVNVPDVVMMDSFSRCTEPMRDKILALAAQAQRIKETRDRLLPKLMSREMDLAVAEV